MPTMAINEPTIDPIRRRTPTISPNTEIALMRCAASVTKFILDVPAILFPRGIGIVVKGRPERKNAAA
jgi:hypothetical protein